MKITKSTGTCTYVRIGNQTNTSGGKLRNNNNKIIQIPPAIGFVTHESHGRRQSKQEKFDRRVRKGNDKWKLASILNLFRKLQLSFIYFE